MDIGKNIFCPQKKDWWISFFDWNHSNNSHDINNGPLNCCGWVTWRLYLTQTDFFTNERMKHVLNLLYFHCSFFRSILNFSGTQFMVYWNTVRKNQNTKKLFCMCSKNKWKIPAKQLKTWIKNLKLKLNFFTGIFRRFWKYDQLNICITAFLRSTIFAEHLQ